MALTLVQATPIRMGLSLADLMIALEEMPEHTVYRSEIQNHYVFVWACTCTGSRQFALCACEKGTITKAALTWSENFHAALVSLVLMGYDPETPWAQVEVEAVTQKEFDRIQKEFYEQQRTGQRPPGPTPDNVVRDGGGAPPVDGEEDSATRAARRWHESRFGPTLP